MTPDIEPSTLNRIDKQGFAGEIFRRNARLCGQRMLRREDQPYFVIKHRRVVQPAARQNI